MHRFGTFLLLYVNALIAVGCDPSNSDQERLPDQGSQAASERPKAGNGAATILLTSEDRALLDRLNARESARAQLREHPGDFVKAQVDGTQDRGIFDSRTRARTMVFKNSSAFDVSDIKGHITFRTEDDRELGSVPFVASGYVYGDDAGVLEVKSGELTGRGTRAQVVVDSVHVWN